MSVFILHLLPFFDLFHVPSKALGLHFTHTNGRPPNGPAPVPLSREPYGHTVLHACRKIHKTRSHPSLPPCSVERKASKLFSPAHPTQTPGHSQPEALYTDAPDAEAPGLSPLPPQAFLYTSPESWHTYRKPAPDHGK